MQNQKQRPHKLGLSSYHSDLKHNTLEYEIRMTSKKTIIQLGRRLCTITSVTVVYPRN